MRASEVCERTGIIPRHLRLATAVNMVPTDGSAHRGTGRHNQYREADLPKIKLVGQFMMLGLSPFRARDLADKVSRTATPRGAFVFPAWACRC